VRQPWHAFAAAATVGLGASIAWPAQDALLATLAGAQDRSGVFSLRHATLNAGLGSGALIAAAIIGTHSPHAFTILYLADAATYLAFIPVLLTLRPHRAARLVKDAPAAAAAPARPPQPATTNAAGLQALGGEGACGGGAELTTMAVPLEPLRGGDLGVIIYSARKWARLALAGTRRCCWCYSCLMRRLSSATRLERN